MPLISCKGLFSDLNDLSRDQREIIKNGSCINPETALVQGSKIFSEQIKLFGVALDKELNGIKILMFYTYQIFDSQDPENPIKTRFAFYDKTELSQYVFEMTLH